MRNLHLLDAFRVNASDFFGDLGDGSCGAFRVSSPIDGGALNVLASSGGGWDHVSVSRVNRCPNWAEMEHIKRMFFREDEAAMQLHVPPAEHRSLHPHCLHLWRPKDCEIPRPPADMVAPEIAR